MKKVWDLEVINQKNSENITKSTNNKESWQSKETTAKGSVESKNSLLSHSPSKDDLEKNNKNNSEDKNNKEIEEDIIPFELIDYGQCVLIEDKNIKDNEILYRQTQRRLKRIISRGRLPRFNLDNFTIEKQIGDGSFGVIYSIYNNKTKKKYAMKKIIANDLDSKGISSLVETQVDQLEGQRLKKGDFEVCGIYKTMSKRIKK